MLLLWMISIKSLTQIDIFTCKMIIKYYCKCFLCCLWISFIVTGPLNEAQIGAVCTEMLKVNVNFAYGKTLQIILNNINLIVY